MNLSVIEVLENAKYNCDNVKKLGIPIIDIVKAQIETAIKMLEKHDIYIEVEE